MYAGRHTNTILMKVLYEIFIYTGTVYFIQIILNLFVEQK